MSRRRWSTLGLTVGLALSTSACAAFGGDSTDTNVAAEGQVNGRGEPVAQQTTSSTEGIDLFTLEEPVMHPMTVGFGDLGPERPVPDACKPTSAGLIRRGSGYLLVVRMLGNVPVIDNPPVLPFGVLMHILELDVGVFVPGTELGGSYRIMRQYQFPDRQPLELGRVADGKAEAIEEVDFDITGNELRVLLPSAGARNNDVGEWGLTVSCALRHPVDSFYFAGSRLPADPPARLPL